LDDLPIYQKAMELSVYLETIYHLVVWEMERSWNRNSSMIPTPQGRIKVPMPVCGGCNSSCCRQLRNRKVPAWYLQLNIRSFFLVEFAVFS
jgi:hypothetical protein